MKNFEVKGKLILQNKQYDVQKIITVLRVTCAKGFTETRQLENIAAKINIFKKNCPKLQYY